MKKESPFDNHPQKIINYDNLTHLTEDQLYQKNLQEYNNAMQLSMKDHIHKLDIIMKEQWVDIRQNREDAEILSSEMNNMKEVHLREEDELIKDIINKCQETELEWRQFFKDEQQEYQNVVRELDELKDEKFVDDKDIINLDHRIMDTENTLGFRKKP